MGHNHHSLCNRSLVVLLIDDVQTAFGQFTIAVCLNDNAVPDLDQVVHNRLKSIKSITVSDVLCMANSFLPSCHLQPPHTLP